jgi:anti-sigma factor RsiW
MPLECRDLSSFLPAYVDGEFEGSETAEIEDHLSRCAGCRRQVSLQEGMKSALRRAVPALAPIELRESLHEKLRDAEGPQGRWDDFLRNPFGVGLAAAAVGAAVWFLAGGLTHPVVPRAGSPLLEDGVTLALHGRQLPLDYTGSDAGALQDWLEKRLPFAARVPRLPHGALQGVRLSHLHSHPAALVSYDLPQPGGRVSLIIVDDPDEPSLPGTARQVADRQVWLSRSRGYNVVSWKTNEIVYQLISDLDERDVLQLVQAAELR